MPVYRDYEIRMNLNELIEKRFHVVIYYILTTVLQKTQVTQIAHDINMDLDLHPVYKQIDEHILRYVKAAGINNEDHWVEDKLKHPHD